LLNRYYSVNINDRALKVPLFERSFKTYLFVVLLVSYTKPLIAIAIVTRLFTCAKRGFYGGLTQKWT